MFLPLLVNVMVPDTNSNVILGFVSFNNLIIIWISCVHAVGSSEDILRGHQGATTEAVAGIFVEIGDLR